MLSIMASCGNSGNDWAIKDIVDSTKIVIDVTEALNMPPQIVDDFITDIKVVPLETNDESALSNVRSVVVGRNCIFVMDSYTKSNVAVFDLDGNFVKRLPFGQGPEEHSGAQCIEYDYKTDCFYLNDTKLDKIIKFDGNGNYISHFPAFEWAEDFVPMDKGFLLIQGPKQNRYSEFRIIETDLLGEPQKRWTLGPGLMDGNPVDNFVKINGAFIFKKQFDNIIYSYSDGVISKRYEVVYDGMPQIDLSEYTRDNDIVEAFPESYFLWSGVKESDDYLWMEFYSRERMLRSIFYNKKAGKFFSKDVRSLPDRFTSWMSTIVGVSGGDNDTWVGLVTPELLLNATSFMDYGWDGSNPNGLISDADMEKLRNVKPDDNPIIVLFKLKDDI